MEFAKIFLGRVEITEEEYNTLLTELKFIECEEWVYADT